MWVDTQSPEQESIHIHGMHLPPPRCSEPSPGRDDSRFLIPQCKKECPTEISLRPLPLPFLPISGRALTVAESMLCPLAKRQLKCTDQPIQLLQQLLWESVEHAQSGQFHYVYRCAGRVSK